MVETSTILLNYLMKTYTNGEVTITDEMIENYKNPLLICHRDYDNRTTTIRTQEYNNKAVDKW